MSLQIRDANDSDRPAIIALLRQSLGESTIPKSEELWKWKHELNPFGESYVLVAEEDGRMVGIRAFMKWQFIRRGKLYKALRAVDTVTHPLYMGRGIFKKLTLRLVETSKMDGMHFIFNTPNQQSRPGYLKMGWIEQGRLPLKMKFLHPVSLMKRKIFPSSGIAQTRGWHHESLKWTNDIFNLAVKHTMEVNKISTIISPAYISWRYANNPLFQYQYLTDHLNVLLIYRFKAHSFGNELRIVEFLLLNEQVESKPVSLFLEEHIIRFCNENKVDFVTMSGQQYSTYKKYFKWMGIFPVSSAGPVITIRDLNMKSDFRRLVHKRYWNYSLGDLELF